MPHGQTSGSNTDITSVPQTPTCVICQLPTQDDAPALSASSTPDQQQMPAGTNCDPPSESIRNDPATTPWRSTLKTRQPAWHSDYDMTL